MDALRRAQTTRLLLAVGVACALAGCLMRAKAGDAPLVGDVRIEGNKHIPAKEIVARLALTTSGRYFIVKFGEEFPYDPELLRVDRMRIERVYETFGYYDAHVTAIRTAVDKGRINIWFVVDEGEPTTTAHVTITGLEGAPPDVAQAVLATPPLKEGDILAEVKYDELKATLPSRLKDFGYWEAAVEGHVLVDKERRTADVRVTVTTGPRYVIDALDVTGTQNVSLRRVREASRLKPDTFISPAELGEAQRRVSGLGVFSQVDVRPGKFDRTTGRVPVVIKVVEAPFQSIEAGAGIEVDNTRQLGRVKGTYTNRNLGRDLQKIILSGDVGYAFVPTLLAFFGPAGTQRESGPIADVSFTFVQPRIFHAPLDLTTGVDYSDELELAFAYQRVGAHLGTIIHVDAVTGLTFTPSLNYDYYFAAKAGVQQPTIPGQTPTAFATSGCGPDENNNLRANCTIGSLQLQINFDRRDDPLSTRKGYFLSAFLEYSNKPFSDFNFVKVSPEARGYVPLGKYFVLAGRLHYGLIKQLGGALTPPGVVRFFSGGGNSVRSASSDELGPREFIVLPNPDKKSKTPYIAGAPIPVGGDQLLEASVELRWFTPLSGLVFAVFFDLGRLDLLNWPVPAVPNTSGGYQYAPGIGVRYYTPVGPLRVDFSYRVSSLDTLPVAVDYSNVKSAADSGVVPKTVQSSSGIPNYRIESTCKGLSGQSSWQCYTDSRFQFFITLGEAF